MPRIVSTLALAAFACAAGPARADVIPPPAQISDVQKALIGIWEQDHCDYPDGLGHACSQRVIAFGSERFSELGFSFMPMSNEFGTGESSGAWTGVQADAKTINVTIKMADGSTTEMVMTMESATAFTLKDSAWSRYPDAHFTRRLKPAFD